MNHACYQSSTSQPVPPTNQSDVVRLGISTDMVNGAIALGSALQLTKSLGAFKGKVKVDEIPESLLDVYLRQSPCRLDRSLSESDILGAKQTIRILNACLGRVIDIIPLATGAIIADMDAVARTSELVAGFSDDLILTNSILKIALIQRSVFSPQSFESLRAPKDRIEILLNIVKESKPCSTEKKQEFPFPITDIAFPSARDAATLERCIRSHLLSLTCYNHKLPQLWVVDDASADEQLLKKEVCQRLAAEFSVNIRHIGADEKRAIRDAILADREFRESFSAQDLEELVFKEGVFGRNRNFVQLILTNKIYSTVDDDSLATCSIEENVQSSEPKRQMRFKRLANELLRAQTQRVGADLQPSQIIEHAFLNARQKSGGLQETKRLIEGLVTSLELEKADLEYIGICRFIRPQESMPATTDSTYVPLPVDWYGVHSREIAARTATTNATFCYRTEASNLILPRKAGSDNGSVVLISSGVNINGAGSVSNNLETYLETKRPEHLLGKYPSAHISFPTRTIATADFLLSTPTTTTIDSRGSQGLVLCGQFDSISLGHSQQGRDSTRHLLQSTAILDHLRQPSSVREGQYSGMDMQNVAIMAGAHESQSILEMFALKIVYGRMGFEVAVTRCVNSLVSFYLENSMGKAKKAPLFDKIIAGIRQGAQIPRFPDFEKEVLPHVKKSADHSKMIARMISVLDKKFNFAEPIRKKLVALVANHNRINALAPILHRVAGELRDDGVLC